MATAMILLLLSDVLFESSEKCMCAKPTFRNCSVFLFVLHFFNRKGYLSSVSFQFHLFERSLGSGQIRSHLFNSDIEGIMLRSAIRGTVPAEYAVFVFLCVWLHN